MHEASAQGWCTGKAQRDGVGREGRGGFRWGTHVNPWLIHVNVWQKPLQYCKVISLQLIKINEKKKETCVTHLFMEETCSWQRREAMRRPGGEGCRERTGELGLEGEAGVF